MLIFRKPFTSYVTENQLTKEQNKQVTIPGQSVPMNLLVQRYASGQVFGLSSFPVEYETDSDNDFDELEGRFRPDPSDPLTYERAAIESVELNEELKRRKNEKVKEKGEPADVPPVVE